MTRLAAIQMTSRDDLDTNLRQAEDLLRRAAGSGATVAVLPENFAVFAPNVQRETAGKLERILDVVSQWSRQMGLWIVAGSIPVLDRPDGEPVPGGRVRAACFVFDDSGNLQARYDKIHLFDVDVPDAQSRYRESDTFEPGDAIIVIDTPAGRLGLSICYDLRFPELYLALRRRGAEVIAVPAAFTAVTGEAHWQTLLRARAIETQCYLVGAGQTGWHNARRQTWGHSQIVDPWGRVLAECPDSRPELCTVEIDPVQLAEIRMQMPLLTHRRLC